MQGKKILIIVLAALAILIILGIARDRKREARVVELLDSPRIIGNIVQGRITENLLETRGAIIAAKLNEALGTIESKVQELASRGVNVQALEEKLERAKKRSELFDSFLLSEEFQEAKAELEALLSDLQETIASINETIEETPSSEVAAIPSEHKDLYEKLEGILADVEAQIDEDWDGSKHPVVFSAGLLMANSNLGETLLRPEVFDLSVKFAERLQELGLKGVAFDINFPLLSKNYHEFNGSMDQYEQYLDFYKRLADEVKKRGLVLSVETNSIFPDFSALPVRDYYSSLTIEQYKEDKAEMLVTIAKELRPDYLAFGNEPDAAEHNTGLPLTDVDIYVGATQFFLEEMDRAGITGVKFGDGFGTWQKGYEEWTEKMTNLADLDFLDLHIYPIDADLLERALEISDVAKQKGKGVAVHEAWLYKWQLSEGNIGIINSTTIFVRDAWSFFAPLDQKFLEVLVKLAHYKEFEYLNPFWTQYLFAYEDYEDVKSLDYNQVTRLINQQVVRNLGTGEFSPTGLFYKELVSD